MHPPPPKPQNPVYTQKPDYGKVPGYLQHNKAKIAEERARADALLLAAEQVICPPATQLDHSSIAHVYALMLCKFWYAVCLYTPACTAGILDRHQHLSKCRVEITQIDLISEQVL